jgi:type IV pilus assembly protein PilC
MALGSGVDFAGAVAITSTIMENSYMTEKLEQMKKLIDNNVAISDAAQKIELFPPVFVKLFNTAYKAGEIDDLLLRMSEYYEDSLENSLHKITAAIEPTLVIILTAIVGAILFSVMLPIINIMQLIG